MLIQSNFKDYYDGAASIGIDKEIIYKRSTSEVQLEDGFFIDGLPQHFPDDLGPERYLNGMSLPDRQYCKWMLIGFCGVYYVGVVNTTVNDGKLHTIAHYGEEILNIEWQKPTGFWRYGDPKKAAEQAIKQWHLKEDQKFFSAFNAPVFAKQILHSLSDYEQKNSGLYLEKIEINPNLNNYKFYKAVDAFTAFQQLQSYISGVLGSKENEIVRVSNESKILKAGFDLKTSFRKGKAKK